MKMVTLPIIVATVLGLAVVPAAWAGQAQQAAKLSQQCQNQLSRTPNKEAAKLCQEGITLHKQGKNDEAVSKLTQGLEKLGVKVEMHKRM
ncbi:MAG: hypothetical protein ACE5IQ_00150 [Candidatus Methylomirabilales bacterium]